jgi:hypothetical protein
MGTRTIIISTDIKTKSENEEETMNPRPKLSEFCKRLNQAHLVFLLAALVLAMASLATTSAIAAEAPQLMFVQSADDLKVDRAPSGW